jgi:hypothetical protein
LFDAPQASRTRPRGYSDTLLNPSTGDSLWTDPILIKAVK